VISIEGVPIDEHWFQVLFGAPAFDEMGRPKALTVEEIQNGPSMFSNGSLPGELRHLEQSRPRARKLSRCELRVWWRHAPPTRSMSLLCSFTSVTVTGGESYFQYENM